MVLEVVRRKGARKTLLTPGGASLDDGVLAPFVGAYDRAAFGRMSGLIRPNSVRADRPFSKGAMMWRARSSRLVLAWMRWALSSRRWKVRQRLSSNQWRRIPTINVLLRQRQELLKRVRETTLGESELTELRRRGEEAVARRDQLIAEAEALGVRANVVERVVRTRAPLVRLAAARAELVLTGGTPVLPPDAARNLAAARSERATAQALQAQHQQDLDEASHHILSTPLPDSLLGERARIESLDERRPAIEKAQNDLSRRLIGA